jgi:hypothetical protein
MHLQANFASIAALDLDPIKVKLMHKESGEGWPLAYADAIEFEYRRFLYLAKQFPNEQAAPLFDVDIFWHYHILDTMKYAADCNAVFGYFLHHFPYIGLRGEDDLEVHHHVGERMRDLYEQTYGERIVGAQATAGDAFSLPAISPRVDDEARPAHHPKMAFSIPTAKFAFSIPTVAPFAVAAGIAWCQGATIVSLVRPILSRAA